MFNSVFLEIYHNLSSAEFAYSMVNIKFSIVPFYFLLMQLKTAGCAANSVVFF